MVRLRVLVVFFWIAILYNVSLAQHLTVVYTPSMQKPINEINAYILKENPNLKITAIPMIAGAALEQIKNGYPADVFISADTMYPTKLIELNLAYKDSYYIYAQGLLVLYSKFDLNKSCLENINNASYIAIINPQLGPYGKATIEALQNANKLHIAQPKFVQAKDAFQALQFAQTGNAQVAFLPYSIVINQQGHYCFVDKSLYSPIRQAMVILRNTQNYDYARKYVNFYKTNLAKQIMKKYGFKVQQ